MDNFPKRLRSKRNELGLTQAQVAEKADINTSTYSAYESGKMPPLDIAYRIAKALDVSIGWLCGEQYDIEIASYGDAIRALTTIQGSFHINVVPRISQIKGGEVASVSFRIDDETLYDFYNKDISLRRLFAESSTTDDLQEVYIAWFEKEIGNFDKMKIPEFDGEE